jgi:hypothetical protein
MYVCVHLFCVYVVCVGSGIATGWSPVQGVLRTVYTRRLRNWKSGQGPTKGCGAIEKKKLQLPRYCTLLSEIIAVLTAIFLFPFTLFASEWHTISISVT